MQQVPTNNCGCNPAPGGNLCFIERVLQTGAIQYGDFVIDGVESLYSWSSDGVCWTNYVDHNQYLSLARNVDGDYFLRLKFRGLVTSVLYCGELYEDYNISIAPQSFLSDVCNSSNGFQPYCNLDCAIQMQQQLADQVICTFGIPVYYFRCEPDHDSLDYTFKEYSLHNVVDVKMLKMMIADGAMPSSNPKLTEMDFDWELDWETELSKTQFASAFGDQIVPKFRDFVYAPMMKRMWKVNAAYEEKNEGLMWRATTWKLALIKYSEANNVITDRFDSVIDTFIDHFYNEDILPQEKTEQDRQSAFSQFDQQHYTDSLYHIYKEDQVRHSYTQDKVSVQDKMLCHRNNIVSRNMYKFKDGGVINYLHQYCGSEGHISFILETGGEAIHRPLLTAGPIVFEIAEGFLFGVEDLSVKLQPFSTYLVVFRWDKKTHTKELYIYRHWHREDMPVYLIRPESYYFDLDHPVVELTGEYNADYDVCKKQPITLTGYPCAITNIKYYNRSMNREEAITESLRYTTDHEACVFNDLARPIHPSTQYPVK